MGLSCGVRRLFPASRCARLLASGEKPCKQAMMQHSRHMASTFIPREGNSTPPQNAGTTTGYEVPRAFQRTRKNHPEVPNLRAPDVRHAAPWCDRRDHTAGNNYSRAASVSSHLNQSAEQVQSRQSAHPYAQGELPKVNAAELNQSHVGESYIRGVNAPLHDRPVNGQAPGQDPATLPHVSSANASALHQDHMGLMNNRGLKAGILNRHPMTPQHETGSPRHPCAVNHGSQSEPDVGRLLYSNAQSEIPDSVAPMQKVKSLGITPPSKEYNVSKARIHASLWQQEIGKLAGGANGNADLVSDLSLQSLHARDCDRNLGFEAKDGTPAGWEMFDPPQIDSYEDSFAKEEAMMFEEFERRRERNRVLIAGFVKQHLYGRRRPVDGWKHIINSFGIQSKASGDSALESGGRQTTTRGGSSELEKLAQKQERRRSVPKR